jgi:transcriptional regulator with XRE-family HTH domain
MMQGSLAEKLRVLRAQRGLSLTEAAEKAGVQRQTIAFLERGERHPHMPTLSKIAHGYGVPVEELLEEPVLAGKANAPEAGQAEEESAEEHRRRMYLLGHRRDVERCAERAEALAHEYTETLSGTSAPTVVARWNGRLEELAEEADRRILTAQWLFFPLQSMARHQPEYRLPDWERSLIAEINDQFARIRAAFTTILDRARYEEQAHAVIEELEPVTQELGELDETLSTA